MLIGRKPTFEELLWLTKRYLGFCGRPPNPAVVEALKTSVETDQDRLLNRINPLAYASAHGLDEEQTIGALCPCGAARAVRHVVEHDVPVMRRRDRGGRGAQEPQSARSIIARSARSIASRRSTGWSRSPSRSIPGFAASPRTIRIRFPSPNTCARSSGARATNSRTTLKARSKT